MTVVGIILLVLIIVCGAAALFLFLRGLLIRSSQSNKPYGVARQEARHEMQVSFLRGGFLLILALILLGIYGLTPDQQSEAQVTVTAAATETTVQSSPAQTATPAASPQATRPVAIESTAAVLTATVSPTATVAPTATASIEVTETSNSAVVNSPNGLWLREVPGGAQELELIAHETLLELLPGRETVDDLEWQQVRTPAGNEGWVAAEFLNYQN